MNSPLYLPTPEQPKYSLATKLAIGFILFFLVPQYLWLLGCYKDEWSATGLILCAAALYLIDKIRDVARCKGDPKKLMELFN